MDTSYRKRNNLMIKAKETWIWTKMEKINLKRMNGNNNKNKKTKKNPIKWNTKTCFKLKIDR